MTDGSALDLDGAYNGTVQAAWVVTPDCAGKPLLALAAGLTGREAGTVTFTDSNSESFSGAIYTSTSTGTSVNQNLYTAKTDVYLNGGPQNDNGQGLPDGTYYFQVTTPSGVLLSTDNAVDRQLVVVNGVVAGVGTAGTHAVGTLNPANGSRPVQLLPFNDTTNAGGEYKVWLIRQTADTSIDPTDPKVILFKNSDSKTDNFKVQPSVEPTTGSVSGFKFLDANGDGSWETDTESGYKGWQIYLDADTDLSNGTTAALQTVAGGGFTFSNVAPGTYYVYEANVAGWTRTLGGPEAGGAYKVAVTAGADAGGNVFGNFEDVVIRGGYWGVKYEDLNGDGQRTNTPQLDEPGLDGWEIRLYRENGVTGGVQTTGPGQDTLVDSTVTATVNSDVGLYKLNPAGPGTYYVIEVLKAGWTQTAPSSGGHTFTVTSSGQVLDGHFDFGNFKDVTFSGVKWEDHDGDGVRDDGDQGLKCWVILVNGEDVGVRTASDGSWSYTAGPGTYIFTEATTGQPWASFTQTYGIDGYRVTAGGDGVASGGNSTGNDFGNFKNVTLSGTKWEDHDGDGVRDDGDQGLQGWTINVGSLTATTGENGNWSLVVGPGTYAIQEAATGQPWASFVETYGTAGYSVTPSSGGDVGGNDFGNTHLGKNQGLTIGYYSNKNGQATITAADLTYLRGLNLRNANGTPFDPTTAKQVGDFLNAANATNMANMLSAQLIATVLNVRHGLVTSTAVYVGPGNQMGAFNTEGAALVSNLRDLPYGAGFVNISALIAAANTELGLYGVSTTATNPKERPYMEAMKDVCDAINNNVSFFVL